MNISVTRPLMPDFADYQKLIAQIWETKKITNHGPLVQMLESVLKPAMGLGNDTNLVLVANGTQAIEILVHACIKKGKRKVVTTPVSFASTATSILWTGFEPVFADFNSEKLVTDASSIEKVLSDDVGLVLLTHLYGRPACGPDVLDLCKEKGIPLIFDGAHTYGVQTAGGPLVEMGLASTLSFHATKVFGTGEGGAIVTRDPELLTRLQKSRSFGFENPTKLVQLGTNSKMSEFHAAYGLAVLKKVPAAIESRKLLWRAYKAQFPDFLRVVDIEAPPITKSNYLYAPTIFPSEKALLVAHEKFKTMGIETRRYFYPSLNTLPYINGEKCPQAEDLSSRLLCMPLYADMSLEVVDTVCKTLKSL